MTGRIGFACKYHHPDRSLSKKLLEQIERPLNERSTTITWLNRQTRDVAEQRLWEIMEHNIEGMCNLVKYVGSLPDDLRMVRIGSNILPAYTQPDWSYYWTDPGVQRYLESGFARVGSLARSLDVRLSFHPGQFVVLASDRPDVVERSIEEFEYHTDMARWMGYGKTFQDFKCNVHISGRAGPAGIINALKRLSPEARNIITIENDEISWGIDSSIELEKHCALVLDIHHHWIYTGKYIKKDEDVVKRVIDSWRGVRPVIHYSVSREALIETVPEEHRRDMRPNYQALGEAGLKRGKLRAHSNSYWNTACNEWAWSFTEDFDIMCESKFKQVASIDFYNSMTGKDISPYLTN
jgi:UV DNA damage endonuclease